MGYSVHKSSLQAMNFLDHMAKTVLYGCDTTRTPRAKTSLKHVVMLLSARVLAY
jgi:hypothetical protein